MNEVRRWATRRFVVIWLAIVLSACGSGPTPEPVTDALPTPGTAPPATLPSSRTALPVGSPVFSPDGSLLAAIRFPPGEEVYTGAVELWRVAGGTLLNCWDCEGDQVAFAADGQSLATWHTMTGVRLWRVPRRVRHRTPSGGPSRPERDNLRS